MKILITGGNGQLGSEIQDMIASMTADLGPLDEAYAGAEVVPTDVAELDITNLEAVDAFLEGEGFDALINCAGATNVDACEKNPEFTFLVNAEGPKNLAIACEKHGVKLVHVSTDYVLPGTNPEPQTEDAQTGPLSVYGKSKLAGEEFVLSNCSRSFVVRTAWLYGQTGPNFLRTMLRISENPRIEVVSDQIGSPTNANDLAYVILKLILTDDYGLYHCTANGQCSWWEFAREIISLAGRDCEVAPCTSEEYAIKYPAAATRPAYSILDNKRLRETLGDPMRHWNDALVCFMNKLKERGEI